MHAPAADWDNLEVGGSNYGGSQVKKLISCSVAILGIAAGASLALASGNQDGKEVLVVNPEPIEVSGVLGVDVLTTAENVAGKLSNFARGCLAAKSCVDSYKVQPEAEGALIYGYKITISPEKYLSTDTSETHNVSNYQCRVAPSINSFTLVRYNIRYTNQVFNETVILPRPVRVDADDFLGISVSSAGENCEAYVYYLVDLPQE